MNEISFEKSIKIINFAIDALQNNASNCISFESIAIIFCLIGHKSCNMRKSADFIGTQFHIYNYKIQHSKLFKNTTNMKLRHNADVTRPKKNF